MLKLFKSKGILSCIFLVAVVFLTIQLAIYQFVFKHLSSKDLLSKFPLVDKAKEHAFNVRGRTIIVQGESSTRPITTSTITIPTKAVHVTTLAEYRARVLQYQLALNEKKQPMVAVCLPFYDMLNLRLNKTYVEDPYFDALKSKEPSDTLIRGVDNKKLALYRPDSNDMFKCINSNQRIPHKNLNDEYCDCVDGTDEPGTSACQFSKFYCKTQDNMLPDNFIMSQKVDDGICDCCDGSDELNKKCKNNCNLFINMNKEKLAKERQGLDRKRMYLESGHNQDERRYGPKGVFFFLSKSCYRIDWSEYTFEVCPFNKVLQLSLISKRHVANIGHISDLEHIKGEHDELVWRLRMSKGDPSNCSQPRSSEILFVCGLKDELLSVQEPQKCLYQFKMSTPAAC